MLPPLVIGTLVQCINMPLVRATITIQNPKCELQTVGAALRHIHSTRGIEGTPTINSVQSTICDEQSVTHTSLTSDALLYGVLKSQQCILPNSCKNLTLSCFISCFLYFLRSLAWSVSRNTENSPKVCHSYRC
jgi:hypothetical protein